MSPRQGDGYELRYEPLIPDRVRGYEPLSKNMAYPTRRDRTPLGFSIPSPRQAGNSYRREDADFVLESTASG